MSGWLIFSHSGTAVGCIDSYRVEDQDSLQYSTENKICETKLLSKKPIHCERQADIKEKSDQQKEEHSGESDYKKEWTSTEPSASLYYAKKFLKYNICSTVS